MTHRRLRKVWERTARSREQRLGPEGRAAAQVRLAELERAISVSEARVAFWTMAHERLSELEKEEG